MIFGLWWQGNGTHSCSNSPDTQDPRKECVICVSNSAITTKTSSDTLKEAFLRHKRYPDAYLYFIFSISNRTFLDGLFFCFVPTLLYHSCYLYCISYSFLFVISSGFKMENSQYSYDDVSNAYKAGFLAAIKMYCPEKLKHVIESGKKRKRKKCRVSTHRIAFRDKPPFRLERRKPTEEEMWRTSQDKNERGSVISRDFTVLPQ